MTNMTNNKNIEDDIKSVDYDNVSPCVSTPDELLKELEHLRTKFKRQKEARVKSIDKNPEKYTASKDGSHTEHGHNH